MLPNDRRIWRFLIAREVISLVGIILLGAGFIGFLQWITSGRLTKDIIQEGRVARFSMEDTKWSPGQPIAIVVGPANLSIMLFDTQTGFRGCKVGDNIRYRVRKMDNGHALYGFIKGSCSATGNT